jgi:hypothetical protein
MTLQLAALLVLGLMCGSELNVAAFGHPTLNRQPLDAHILVRSSRERGAKAPLYPNCRTCHWARRERSERSRRICGFFAPLQRPPRCPTLLPTFAERVGGGYPSPHVLNLLVCPPLLIHTGLT